MHNLETRPSSKNFRKPVTAEKKHHTLKALVVTTLHREILFLFGFVAGSVHDYTLMKTVFDPKSPWFDAYPYA